MPVQQLEGGCLCGHIRFRAIGEPQNPHTCSCTMCQQHSGAPTLSWVVFAKEDVVWTGVGGTPSLYRASDFSSRTFCPCCGSNLGAIDDAPTVGLVTGSFDSRYQPLLRPVAHSFEDSRPAWWTFKIE